MKLNGLSENNEFSKVHLILLSLLFLIVSGYVFRGIVPFNFEVVYLLVILFSIYIYKQKKSNTVFSKPIVYWFILLLFYWLVNLFSVFYHGHFDKRSLFVLNVSSTVFIFFALYFVIVKIKPSVDYFWYFLGLTASVLVLLMAIELVAFNFDITNRVGGYYYNPLRYGVFSSSIAAILLGSYWWAANKNRLILLTYVVLTILLIVAAILSQTRNALPILPIAIVFWGVYYLYVYKDRVGVLNKKIIFASIAIFIIITSIITTLFSAQITKRFAPTLSNIESYTYNENFHTSIGYRLMMYEASINGIKNNFWFGIGEHEFERFLKLETQKIAKEKFDESFNGLHFSNVHNQFLMSWLTKGVFAFLSIVLIFIFLFIYFIGGLKKSTMEDKSIWIAGLIFTIAIFLYTLPQTPFQKSLPFTHIMLHLTYLMAFTHILISKKIVACK